MLKFWIDNSRYNALPQSILPAIVAIVYAWPVAGFSWLYALMALFGVAMAHLSLNLFDDYFDYRHKGTAIREKLDAGGIRARLGKCYYLTSGKTTMKQLFWVATLFGLIALLLGFFIFLKRGNVILYITLITMLIGLSYSAPPLKLSYIGLGEPTIAIVFGPLLMSGVYYAACGLLSNGIWFISVPVGLLVANIVYSHAIMDYEHDKRAHKMTFAVLLRNRTAMLVVSALFMLCAYLVIAAGFFIGLLSRWYLLTLITLPLAVNLFYLLVMFVKHPEKTYHPRWWMQPMERWAQIKEAGIDWFMIRWFLSRNLVTWFCLIIVIISLIIKK
jgi:1,4-dihydroxy-2-naphthoate octaprenyltransferase